jgi:hypothetical protein
VDEAWSAGFRHFPAASHQQGLVMTRILASLALAVALAAPVSAIAQSTPQSLSPQALAAQNLAIASSVQQQLLACWRLPPGYQGRSISVRLAFLGDGTLDGDPHVVPDSLRVAGKYPELMRSIAQAISRCVPFAGLEELGALPGERFDITVHFSS